MADRTGLVAGVDVGTECVKSVILNHEKEILARTILPTRGSFQDRSHEAMVSSLDEAGVGSADLDHVIATGFGAKCVPGATGLASSSTCHAIGAYHRRPEAMTVIDIGGRDPSVIRVDSSGMKKDSRAARRCAMGIGTFLMFAARHLDVHPTRLEELAATAERPAVIGSYCSVFAGTEILERLREGVSRAEIALGCMHSIAERILEIGGFEEPLIVTGGVAEYFPGVLKILAERTGMGVEAVPEPILAGAIGAALLSEGADLSAK